MPREVVSIARSAVPDYEYAALVYEILAYPEDHAARERFGDAFCYIQIREAARRLDGWAQKPQPIRPVLMLQDSGAAEKSYADGLRVISNERLIAGKMAAPTIGQAEGVLDIASAPTSTEALMAASVDLDGRPRRGKPRGKSSEGNRGNIINRHWTPSRPVLHLCLALHELSHRLDAGHDVAFDARFWMREFVDELLNRANRIAPRLGECFDIAQDEWIKVEAA